MYAASSRSLEARDGPNMLNVSRILVLLFLLGDGRCMFCCSGCLMRCTASDSRMAPPRGAAGRSVAACIEVPPARGAGPSSVSFLFLLFCLYFCSVTAESCQLIPVKDTCRHLLACRVIDSFASSIVFDIILLTVGSVRFELSCVKNQRRRQRCRLCRTCKAGGLDWF